MTEHSHNTDRGRCGLGRHVGTAALYVLLFPLIHALNILGFLFHGAEAKIVRLRRRDGAVEMVSTTRTAHIYWFVSSYLFGITMLSSRLMEELVSVDNAVGAVAYVLVLASFATVIAYGWRWLSVAAPGEVGE